MYSHLLRLRERRQYVLYWLSEQLAAKRGERKEEREEKENWSIYHEEGLMLEASITPPVVIFITLTFIKPRASSTL